MEGAFRILRRGNWMNVVINRKWNTELRNIRDGDGKESYTNEINFCH